MDKSKQRDALVEYMKIQQQKIRSTEPYQPNDNYSQYNRATVQSHSTILVIEIYLKKEFKISKIKLIVKI